MHSCRPKWGGASGWQNRSAAPCRTHQSKTDCEEAPEGCWWHNQANVCDNRHCSNSTSKETCNANSNCNWEGQPTTTVPTQLFSTTTTPYKRERGRCVEVDCTLLSENIGLCAARSDCLWDELDGGSCGKRTCDTLVSEVRLLRMAATLLYIEGDSLLLLLYIYIYIYRRCGGDFVWEEPRRLVRIVA